MQGAETALHLAAANGRSEIVTILLTANVNIEAKSQVGLTPLYVAAMHGHTEVVRILLKAHAEFDIPRLELFLTDFYRGPKVPSVSQC
jgi:ankyrin repeat protein